MEENTLQLPQIDELVAAVELSGHIISERFALPHTIERKEDNTPVTATDIEVNQSLANYAEHWGVGFLGEEGNGEEEGHEYYLFVDPLDGTGAYTRGMATATVIASIMYRGTPVMAVIHNPITRQTWFAEKNRGAKYAMRGKIAATLKVPHEPTSHWRTAICAWPGVDSKFAQFKAAVVASEQFSDQAMGAFGIGGGMIALGTIHATAISGTSAVESAAMSLIVSEAGGIATNLYGEPLHTFELGENKGKKDFLLPKGAIFANTEELAEVLSDLYLHG